MKRRYSTGLAVLAATVIMMLSTFIPAVAADTDAATTIQGTLVDVACATANAKKPKADFAVKHSKDCLQMPDCAESGYAVLTSDNKIIRFDAKGNELAKTAIDKTKKENDMKVSVTGKVKGDQIAVASLNIE